MDKTANCIKTRSRHELCKVEYKQNHENKNKIVFYAHLITYSTSKGHKINARFEFDAILQ